MRFLIALLVLPTVVKEGLRNPETTTQDAVFLAFTIADEFLRQSKES